VPKLALEAIDAGIVLRTTMFIRFASDGSPLGARFGNQRSTMQSSTHRAYALSSALILWKDPFSLALLTQTEEMAKQFLECQANQQQQPPPTPSQEPVEMLFDDYVDQSSSVIQDQSSSSTSVNQEQPIM
jgi:hypothetical protein